MKTFVCFIVLTAFNLIFSQSGWFSRNPQPQYSTYSIKFFNPSTGIGLCDSGIIIRTTDSGYSWNFIQSGTNKPLLCSYFLDNNLGYAVGDNGAIIKTINGGNNWSLLNSGVNNILTSIFFTDVNTGFVCGSSGIVLKTTNSGLNWTQSILTNKKLNTVFFTSSGTGYIGGDTSFVYKTTNYGTNWNPQYINENYIANIYFINNATGFIKTKYNLFRTSDAGSFWQQSSLSNVGTMNSSIDFLNSTTGYLAISNSQIYKTTNSGINWIGRGPQNVFPPFKIYCMDILDSLNVFISCDNGQIFKTSSSSYVWQHIGGNNLNYSYFTFLNESVGFVHAGNYILSTSNGGNKWLINSYGDNNWFEPSFVSYNKIVSIQNKVIRSARGYGGGVGSWGEYASFSTDSGLNWTTSTGGTYEYVTDVNLSGDYGYAILRWPQSSILRKTSGSIWSTLYTSISSENLYRVAFHNNNTGMLVGWNSNNSSYFLLRTINGGNNWIYQPPIVPNSLREIQLFPTGTGIILCDSSMVLGTTDYSSSWAIRYASGAVKFRCVSMLDDNFGFGISTTNKFVRTSNGGISWSVHETSVTKRMNNVQFLNQYTGYIIGDSGTVLKTTDGGLTFVNPNIGLTPQIYLLAQNYPNPFNPITNIKFELPKAGFVKLVIYDLLGREIMQLVNQQMQAGSYSVDWDASVYPSGVYFYSIEAGDYKETRKMVLIK